MPFRLRLTLILLCCLALSAEASLPTDAATQYCYHYIKGLKLLWYDIHHSTIEQVMAEHPPEDDGMDRKSALLLANEINSVGPEAAQAWIEAKWNACIADPYSVRR